MGSEEVILLDAAVGDVQQGKAFYDQRQAGLGDYFSQCILSDLESLKVYAGVHIQINASVYRMKSKRFPYAIYYRLNPPTACVVAVLPLRRKPSWIKQMVGSRN